MSSNQIHILSGLHTLSVVHTPPYSESCVHVGSENKTNPPQLIVLRPPPFACVATHKMDFYVIYKLVDTISCMWCCHFREDTVHHATPPPTVTMVRP